MLFRSNKSAASFTFAGAEVGTTYSFTLSSNGGGAPVTGSGSIATIDQQISTLDLSCLSDGTVTLSVALTDGAGNTGGNATDTVTLDKTAPVATAVPVKVTGPAGYINLADMTRAVTITATVSASAAVGDVVELLYEGSSFSPALRHTIVAAGETASFTVPAGSFTGVDGDKSITTKVTDTVGNTPATSTALVVKKDTTPPVVVISTIASDDATYPLYANAGDTITLTYTVTDINLGTTDNVTVTIAETVQTDSAETGVAATSSRSVDASGELQGPVTYSVLATDLAGNTGSDSSAASGSLTIDTTPPEVVIASIASDDVTYQIGRAHV